MTEIGQHIKSYPKKIKSNQSLVVKEL